MHLFKRLRFIAFAKFQAMLFMLVGLLAGVLYAFGGLIFDAFTTGLNLGTALAFLAILGMPLIFACVGFLLGLVEAAMFNFFSRLLRFFNFSYEEFLDKDSN